VLDRVCPECGFDTSSVELSALPDMIRANADAWRAVLARGDVAVRPQPDVWSALEYACHVRDVCRVYDGRLVRMLAEDDPLYSNWDQDATALADRYHAQSPALVADELASAADALAARFATVHGAQWNRSGRRSDGARFTIATFARYFVHDPIHHLHDVARGFSAIEA